MISVSTGLDNLVGEEVLVKSVHGLLGSVVPADVHHRLPAWTTVGAIDLSGDRFGEIVWVLNVNPVSDLVELAIVQDAIRYRNLAVLVRKVSV